MLKLIFYIVVGLLILSFFGISLQHVIESPAAQANFGFMGDLLKEGWEKLLSLVTDAWHSVMDLIGIN